MRPVSIPFPNRPPPPSRRFSGFTGDIHHQPLLNAESFLGLLHQIGHVRAGFAGEAVRAVYR
jgi:hypothetical protein